MKLFLLALLFSTQAFAAAVPVTITFNVPSVAYLADVEQSRFLQIAKNSIEGTVAGAMTSGATSMSITGTCPAANTAVLIDQEPILITAGVGTSTCTITRNSALAQAGTVAAGHSSGVPIQELVYASAQAYFVRVGVQNFLSDLIRGLGVNSAVIGTAASAIQSNQSSIGSSISGAAQ